MKTKTKSQNHHSEDKLDMIQSSVLREFDKQFPADPYGEFDKVLAYSVDAARVKRFLSHHLPKAYRAGVEEAKEVLWKSHISETTEAGRALNEGLDYAISRIDNLLKEKPGI